jgi:hypothetical protein
MSKSTYFIETVVLVLRDKFEASVATYPIDAELSESDSLTRLLFTCMGRGNWSSAKIWPLVLPEP